MLVHRLLASALLLVILTACGSPSSPLTTPDSLADLDPELQDAIELRLSLGLQADEDWVRQVADDPRASSELLAIPLTPEEAAQIARQFAMSEATVGRIQAYAARHRDEFGGLYIDNPSGGVVVALFTDNLAAHESAVAALVGEVGRFRVQGVRFTEDQLMEVMDRVTTAVPDLAGQGIAFLSAGVDTIGNRVEVLVKSANPMAGQMIESMGPGGAIIVAVHPPDGPWVQPDEGDGWRLLAREETRLPYTVALAEDRQQLARELERHAIPDDALGEWDPSVEVVALFSDGIGGGCRERRLDDVILDHERGLVFARISDPLQPRGCDASLEGAQTFVVALARSRLPDQPFILRLSEELIGCHPDCGSGPTQVEVMLHAP